MVSTTKTHVRLANSSSGFFKKLKKNPENKIELKRQIQSKQTESHSAQEIKVRLILEREFKKNALKTLNKLYKIPTNLIKGSHKEFQLGLEQIRRVANGYGLKVGKVTESTRMIELLGSIEEFEHFFNIDLDYYDYTTTIKNADHSQTVLGHAKSAHIPLELHGMIHSIIGLQNTPLDPQSAGDAPYNESRFVSAAVGKSTEWIANYYNFPKNTDGSGQHIGIISCGGGFSQDEFNYFFKLVGIKGIRPIRVVNIDNVPNKPGGPWLYDYEIATDCLVAACAAPGVQLTVYFCKVHMNSFINAMEYILEEGESGPSIISYSWGKEEDCCKSDMEGVNRILEDAAINHNKSIFCASGDFGSTNNSSFPKERDELEVIFPSSSPWVTSCGGTMFSQPGKENSTEEEVWNSVFLYGVLVKNATGGGFSKYIHRPKYQKQIIPDLVPSGYIDDEWVDGIPPEEHQKTLIEKFKPYRGVPDVAGHAAIAPEGFGYWIYFQNKSWLAGGTSAVAPLWAALTARLNQSLGKNIGFFNTYLYEMADSNAFKPILKGHNGLIEENTHWIAGESWNPCTGLGVPNGENILRWLKKKFAE